MNKNLNMILGIEMEILQERITKAKEQIKEHQELGKWNNVASLSMELIELETTFKTIKRVKEYINT